VASEDMHFKNVNYSRVKIHTFIKVVEVKY
jgi:hypothetical protein